MVDKVSDHPVLTPTAASADRITSSVQSQRVLLHANFKEVADNLPYRLGDALDNPAHLDVRPYVVELVHSVEHILDFGQLELEFMSLLFR